MLVCVGIPTIDGKPCAQILARSNCRPSPNQIGPKIDPAYFGLICVGYDPLTGGLGSASGNSRKYVGKPTGWRHSTAISLPPSRERSEGPSGGVAAYDRGWPEDEIDHVNGDPSPTGGNPRPATRAQNCRNIRTPAQHIWIKGAALCRARSVAGNIGVDSKLVFRP